MSTLNLDVVYTWVDDSDSNFTSSYKRHAQEKTDLNPERYRDLFSTLKYSLRSVSQFAPWVNKIFIVTPSPQVPSWLNQDHPKIQVIHHEHFIDKEYLPTFNPRVIQSFLHQIPGSSEHFIYMNDDYLLGRSNTVDDYVTNNGRLKVMGSIFGIPLWFRVFAEKNRIKGLPAIEHTPWIIKKSYWTQMLSMRTHEIALTRTRKFRRPDDIRFDRLYRYFLLSRKRKQCSIVPAFELLKYHKFHSIRNTLNQQKTQLEALKAMQPKFYCLNDDQRDNPNPEVVALVQQFLEDYYPEKSAFEL